MRPIFFVIVLAFEILSSATKLSAQVASQSDTLAELSRRIDILTQEIEKTKLGEVIERKYESRYGMGPAASQVYHLKKSGVSLAGYGEVLYQNFSKNADNNAPSGRLDEWDYLRHIVYTGFRFNERLLFNAEIEFEHGSTGSGKAGEVSVEFGYVEAMFNSNLSFRAGMVLLPVGIVNEQHEPPTYLGALRPETESQIIPSTWRGNGGGLVGSTASGLGFKLYLVESLNAAKFSASGIRSGRQSGARALAEDLALTGRVDYSGLSGLNLGASFFTGNTGQGLLDRAGRAIGARVTLFSTHAVVSYKGFEGRGVYARSTLAEVDSLNRVLNLTGNKSLGKTHEGFYFTLGYDVMPLLKPTAHVALIPFVQYEKLNTQKDVPRGFSLDDTKARANWTLGLSFKPHPNVAFKVDYLDRKNDAGTGVDQFNFAVTYLY